VAGEFVTVLVAPADRVRAAVLRVLGPTVRPLLSDRELRVAVTAGAAMILLFTACMTIPGVMLSWGPIALGVPHLLGDLRYLVARRGLARRRGFWILVAIPLAATWIWPTLPVGLCAVLGAILLARGPIWLLAAGGALIYVCARAGFSADLIFAHGHNLIALGIWWAWSRRAGRAHLVPLLLFVAAAASIFLNGGPAVPGDLGLAPLGVSEEIAARFVIFFAFAQAVHYTVWLRLIPEEDRERPGVRSFASSARALIGDLGGWIVVVAVLAQVALIAWAILDVDAARRGYLRVGVFHGHLELAVIALFVLEGRK
jgi:hypothetical protein